MLWFYDGARSHRRGVRTGGGLEKGTFWHSELLRNVVGPPACSLDALSAILGGVFFPPPRGVSSVYFVPPFFLHRQCPARGGHQSAANVRALQRLEPLKSKETKKKREIGSREDENLERNMFGGTSLCSQTGNGARIASGLRLSGPISAEPQGA